MESSKLSTEEVGQQEMDCFGELLIAEAVHFGTEEEVQEENHKVPPGELLEIPLTNSFNQDAYLLVREAVELQRIIDEKKLKQEWKEHVDQLKQYVPRAVSGVLHTPEQAAMMTTNERFTRLEKEIQLLLRENLYLQARLDEKKSFSGFQCYQE